jgi:hypothetical protein
MKLRIPLAFLLVFSIAACGTLEIGLEKPPAPTAVVATQQVAMSEPTRESPPPVVSPSPAGSLEPSPSPAVSPSQTAAPASAPSLQLVVAWPGFVSSAPAGSNYADYVVFLSKGAGEVGLVGNTPELEQQIAALRDKHQEPSHFWGRLQCPADDYQGCQLKVEKVRAATELYAPDAVESWEGTLGCGQKVNAAVAEPCSATTFMLAGKFPVVFDTWALEPDLQAKLTELRGTGTPVRLWGEVTAGIPVYNGVQIKITRLEAIN